MAAVGLCDRGEPANTADVDVPVAAGLSLRHHDHPPAESSDAVGAPHSPYSGDQPIGRHHAAGLLRGLTHEDAARFAFLMATPVIAAGLF